MCQQYLRVSLYYFAEAITVIQWSRLSDKLGRKPVLLCGLISTSVSSVLFGLSRSLWAVVFRQASSAPIWSVVSLIEFGWPLFEWGS